MAQRALVRGSIAVAATFAMASGLACVTAPAAVADAQSEAVIPAALRDTPRGDVVAFAGPGGFLHRQEGQSGFVWTKYSGGPDTPVPGSHNMGVGNSGAGADIVATVSGTAVQLQDMDAGTTTTITLPNGQSYLGTFGARVLTYVKAADGTISAVHVLSEVNGQQADTQATGWPAGAGLGAVALAGDANSVVLKYSDGTGNRLALLDLASGEVTPVFGTVSSNASAVLTNKYVGWYAAGTNTTLHLLSRSDLTASATTVQVPLPPLPAGTQAAAVRSLAISGDSLLALYNFDHTGPQTADMLLGDPLYAMPLSGGSPITVLDHANLNTLRPNPNGAVAVGGSSLTNWAARQISPGPNGTLTPTAVDSDPAVPAPIDGLSLADGQLTTIERGSSPEGNAFTRSVQLTGGTPTYSDRTLFGTTEAPSDCDTDAGCAPPIGTGDGRISQLGVARNGSGNAEVTVQEPGSTYAANVMTPSTSGGHLVDSDGRYVVYDGGSPAEQYVGEVGPGVSNTGADGVLFTRPVTAAALSGTTMWVTNASAGSLSSIDLTTRQAAQTINTGAPCVPNELQAAAGRWVYWSCGTSGPAGIYDLATKTDIPVPSSGLALLGDGYLVEHDTSAGKLVMTDVHTDTAATSELADLPTGPLTDDRRVTWTVDKYGGGIAYLDANNDIHVVDPHISASPAYGYRMLPGQRLNPGQSLESGSMRLEMQTDGNLVAYLKAGGGKTPEWSSGTWGNSGAYAVMQGNGDLAVYRKGGGPGSGGVLWSSGTSGHPGAYATLQDDGNLVIYRQGTSEPNTTLWSSGSNAQPQTIVSNEVLKPGWWTQARYTFLVMQRDGNLVMYRKRDGAPIWASRTAGNPGAYAVMQGDGNFVVYRKGGGPGTGDALWSSGTWGNSGACAVMQDDGNLVVYRKNGAPGAGGALWASGTYKTAH